MFLVDHDLIQFSMPIEIFYNGDQDLSLKTRNIFSSIVGVRVVDLNAESSIDLEKIGFSGGFMLKPVALILSSFRHAMLMDADTVLLTKPEDFFASPSYISTGTLFYQDRILFTSMCARSPH